MTWWVVFFGLDLYGWNVWTIHATLTKGGQWETNVNHSWRNPPKSFYKATWETNIKNSWRNPPLNLFWNNSHLPKKTRETVRQMQRLVWGTPQRTLWEAFDLLQRTPFLWLKTPKLTQLTKKLGGTFHRTFFAEKIGKQMYRRVRGTFHITREDWETNAKKSWGDLPQNLLRRRLGDKCKEKLGEPSTEPGEPFSRPAESAPRNARRGGRPETFTMAKDPKANAIGEQTNINQK